MKKLKLAIPVFLVACWLPFSALCADYPPAVGLALSKAVPLIEKKDYNQAIAILEKILDQKEGQHKTVYLLLGNCFMLKNDYAKAARAYGSAVEKDGNDSSLWMNLGKSQYELKQYAKAAGSFAAAWEKENPAKRQPDALYYSSGSWLLGNQHKKAIASFEKLFSAYPDKISIEWREQYIHALIEADQTRKALPQIQTLIRLTSGKKKMQWQEILLSQYLTAKMYKQARELTRNLTEESPGEAKWWKAMAHVELASGQTKEALAALIAYSYLKPLEDSEQALLADLYLENNIPGQAAPLYQEDLKRRYKNNTLQRLVLSLRRQGQEDQALQILRQYEKQVNKCAVLLQITGELCYDKKDFANAALAYKKAAGLKGDHQGQCYLMAGYAFMQKGEKDACKKYLWRAMKYNAQKKNAERLLMQINRQAG